MKRDYRFELRMSSREYHRVIQEAEKIGISAADYVRLVLKDAWEKVDHK